MADDNDKVSGKGEGGSWAESEAIGESSSMAHPIGESQTCSVVWTESRIVGESISSSNNGVAASIHGADWDEVLEKIERLKAIALKAKERDAGPRRLAKRRSL